MRRKFDALLLFPLAVATAFGVGYVPFAPGTAGSLVGLIAWWALSPRSIWLQGFVIVVLLIVGSICASVAERHFDRSDPGQVVVDEVMGMLATLFLVPVGWKGAVGGFCLFRAADILKPFPARRLERLPAGMGVMADDLMAAIYANLALRLALLIGQLVT